MGAVHLTGIDHLSPSGSSTLVDCQRKAAARLLTKVDVGNSPAGCWMWTGGQHGKGYGTFWFEGRSRPAHIVAYRLLVGPVPEGMDLDHLCRERSCVNPLHLEAITHQENCARADMRHRGPRIGVDLTHCPKGHEYTEDNIYQTGSGSKACRECHRARQRARGARLRAGAIA